MNLRFWGGWFLAIAGLVVMLSMGCEKGALGVKPSMVTGRIVKADNDSVGIVAATVRVMSKEAQGTSELKMGKNFLTTTTNADGFFTFDNVIPDNVVIEYSKGANRGVYPSTKTSTTDAETGAISESASLDAVYVKSGAVVNVGALPLTQSEGSLPSKVNLKIDLVNKTTLEKITDPGLKFVVTVNGVPLADASENTSLTADQLRLGIDRTSEQTLKIIVRHDSDNILYQTTDSLQVTISGEEIYERIELTPVSYNMLLRCVNVPDYITISSALVNVFAETPTDGVKPPQVLATHVIANPGSAGELPTLITIPALSMPVDLRIQVRGYKDEVVKITENSLRQGAQGSYRLDVDFLYDNATFDGLPGTASATSAPFEGKFIYDPSDANLNRAGMFNNMLRRDVVLIVAGEDLQTGNWVSGMISLPRNGRSFESWANDGSSVFPKTTGESAPVNSPVNMTFAGVAVGYKMGYSVTVSGSASGSFVLSSPEDGIMINPDTDSLGRAIAVGVVAKRPSS